jgi:ribosomal protein L11
MKDLNANDIDAAMRMIEGAARSWALRFRTDGICQNR